MSGHRPWPTGRARQRSFAERTAAIAQRGVSLRKTAHDPGDPLITSHCPFCGSGQVVGRSDGTIMCDFCGQAYIVRVQPAFPGMPQMPAGPGAPSDVGPDGGMIPPDAVGPDGMPADPGMEEDDEGAPPFGGDEDTGPPDDDNGAPSSGGPSSGRGKSDDSGSKKKPSKSGSGKTLAYRGFDGQLLNEDQYVRHLAVALSGAHPAVMAALRADARSSSRRAS